MPSYSHEMRSGTELSQFLRVFLPNLDVPDIKQPLKTRQIELIARAIIRIETEKSISY